MEDIRGQQLAYNTHLETVRADHERVLAVETEKQNVQSQSNLGQKESRTCTKRHAVSLWVLEQLRKDLARTHSNDVEERDRAHGKELSALRLQLDRALELSKIKVRDSSCFRTSSHPLPFRSARPIFASKISSVMCPANRRVSTVRFAR